MKPFQFSWILDYLDNDDRLSTCGFIATLSMKKERTPGLLIPQSSIKTFNMGKVGLQSFNSLTIVSLSVLLMCIVSSVSSFRYNGSCSSQIECLPRETFMRCTKGRCLCAADSLYDHRNGYCRLKINVKCFLSGKNIQPCVNGAFCDPPTYADGGKILGASSGNCKCYQGQDNIEDGTCSAAASLQRSFGYSSLIFGYSSTNVIILCLVSLAVPLFSYSTFYYF